MMNERLKCHMCLETFPALQQMANMAVGLLNNSASSLLGVQAAKADSRMSVWPYVVISGPSG